MSIDPKISCLCVTKGRPHFLQTAVRCFFSQEYVNKELVVVFPHDDLATAGLLASLGSSQVVARPMVQAGVSLGTIRNFAIDAASGDYLCTWDDDDWHSPARLRYQHAALELSKKPASVLTRLLLFDVRTACAYLGYERLWENTVMFHRDSVCKAQIRFPDENLAEDYKFVNALIKANFLFPTLEPTLYVYRLGQHNTCPAAHIQKLMRHSAVLTEPQSAAVARCFEPSADPQDVARALLSRDFRSSLGYVRHSAVPRP